jgi:hypothetical protein
MAALHALQQQAQQQQHHHHLLRLPQQHGGHTPRAGCRRRTRQCTCAASDPRRERDYTAVDPLDGMLAVPADQRPVNELNALKETFLYNW